MTSETELQADCARCIGLCCVALALVASADFAIDKAAGQPCPHLRLDFRCEIHSSLREQGFPGCSVYDCFGAGQRIAQDTFAGHSWRDDPALAEAMFAAFGRLRDVHELLWYVREALQLEAARPLDRELRNAYARLAGVGSLSVDALVGTDVAILRGEVNPLLREVSALARRGLRGKDLSNTDLVGARMAGANLRGASLRGARLIGADLHGGDLRLADLTAADLRNTDLRAADLSTGLFVRQAQLEAARGDERTLLPAQLHRPGHWLS